MRRYDREDEFGCPLDPLKCELSGIFGGGGHTTTTSTSTPWAPQVPFLKEGFNQAQNLFQNYTPQYYPSSTVAPFSPGQIAGLTGIENQAITGEPITNATGNFGTALEAGNFLHSDPGNPYYTDFAGTNVGTSNAGAGTLASIFGSNPGANLPGSATLEALSGSNPAASIFGMPQLESLSNTNFGVNNAGTPTLNDYASGKYLNANGYTDPTAQTVLSQVVPQIESQFINGGAMSNPAAAFATSQGATSALAPIEFQNFQTQEGLQNNAAQALATNTLTGAQVQGNQATNAGNLGLTGTGQQASDANSLINSILTGTGLQEGAASNYSGNAISGNQLQQNAAGGLSNAFQDVLGRMVTGEAVAPEVQAMPYFDPSQLLSAGTTDQTQAQSQLTDLVNRFNYYQELPYQQLDQYMGTITGNYGGTTTQKDPYNINPVGATGSTLGGINTLLGGAPGGAGALVNAGGLSGVGDAVMAFISSL